MASISFSALAAVDTLNGGYDDDTIEAGEGYDLILAIHELDGGDTIDGGIGVGQARLLCNRK